MKTTFTNKWRKSKPVMILLHYTTYQLSGNIRSVLRVLILYSLQNVFFSTNCNWAIYFRKSCTLYRSVTLTSHVNVANTFRHFDTYSLIMYFKDKKVEILKVRFERKKIYNVMPFSEFTTFPLTRVTSTRGTLRPLRNCPLIAGVRWRGTIAIIIKLICSEQRKYI